MANKKLHKKSDEGERNGFHAESGQHATFVIPGGDACNNAQIDPKTGIWAKPNTLEDQTASMRDDKRALREFS